MATKVSPISRAARPRAAKERRNMLVDSAPLTKLLDPSVGNCSFISCVSAPLANRIGKAEGQAAGVRAMRDVNCAALGRLRPLRRTICRRSREPVAGNLSAGRIAWHTDRRAVDLRRTPAWHARASLFCGIAAGLRLYFNSPDLRG